jgi:hypothetical protein
MIRGIAIAAMATCVTTLHFWLKTAARLASTSWLFRNPGETKP